MYELERTGSRERRALKIAHCDPADASARLDRELEALRSVDARYAPAVYEQGEFEGRRYFVMEALSGRTVAECLAEAAGPLDRGLAQAVARGLLVAIEAVHQAGLLHGDLKPENLFLEQGHVRILDFGSARRLATAVDGVARGGSILPSTAGATGTAEYMSPEQCDGAATADVRSDMYAVGILLYELFTGAPPFWGSAAEVREAHRSRRPSPLNQVPPALSQLILSCLAKDPERRPATAAALLAALEQAWSGWHAAPDASAPQTEARDQKASANKRLVAVAYFLSSAAVELERMLGRLGGQLVYRSGKLCAAVFGHEVADNPARAALSAADALISRSLCASAILDVALVSVRSSPSGAVRYFSPSFAKKDRYPTADDPAGILLTPSAAQVLGDLAVAPHRGTLVRVLPADARDETVLLQPQDFVGRQALLSDLRCMAQSAVQRGCPAVALICAPAGYGKSHLARELARELEQQQMVVFRIRAMDRALLGSRATTELIVRACLGAVPSPDDGGEASLRQMLGAQPGDCSWVAVALALGWVQDDHPEIRRLQAAPGALRAALSRATGELVRHAAQRAPTAFLLDGAELADDASLEALGFAALATSQCPLFVAVLTRPGFDEDHPSWGRHASAFRRFDLAALDEAEAGELARRLLEPAEYVPAWAIERLVQRTQGVPGLIVELVRGLKHEGLVRRHERGTGHYLAGEVLERLPDMPILTWSARREVESLSAELTAHARLASVLGGPFTQDLLERLMNAVEQDGGLEGAVLDAGVGVTRLVDAGLLVRKRTGAFDFRTCLLREAVYEAAPEAFRLRAHGAAHRLFAAQPEPYSADTCFNLAFHAAHSGQATEAMRWYRWLGERAFQRQSYQEAAQLLDAALAQGLPDQPATARILYRRGLARFRVGRLEDAVVDFSHGAELSRTDLDPQHLVEHLLAAAMVTDWMHQFDRSSALVQEAQRALPNALPARLAAEMLMAQGRVRHRAGEQQQAVALLAHAAEKALPLGDEGYEILVISLLLAGFIYPMLGRLDEAEAALAQAVEAAESHHDQAHLAAALNNRVSLWFGRAETRRLLADLERVLEIARSCGLLYVQGPVEHNWGEALYCMGDLERAEEHTRRALEAHGRVGASVRTVNTAELLLARIQLYRQDLDAAQITVALLEERAAKAKACAESDVDLVASDLVMLEAVELAIVGADSDVWDELARGPTVRELAPHERADWLEIRAMAEMRAGRPDAARAALQAAAETARTMAPLLVPRILRRLEDARE